METRIPRASREQKGNVMTLILVIVLIFILVGGGSYGYTRYPTSGPYLGGGFVLLLVVLLLLYVLGFIGPALRM